MVKKMKVIKPAVIFVISVLVFLGTFKLASSVGVVPWFRISDNESGQSVPAITYNSTTNQYLTVWEDWRGDTGFGSE